MGTLGVLKFYFTHIKKHWKYIFIYVLSVIVISSEASFIGLSRTWIIDTLAKNSKSFIYYIIPLTFFACIILFYELAHLCKIWCLKKTLP